MEQNEIEKLYSAISNWETKIKPYRDLTRTFIDEYTGDYYFNSSTPSDEAAENSTRPVNMVNSFVNIVLPNLVTANPKVNVSLKSLNGDTFDATNLEAALNQKIKEVDLQHLIRLGAKNALFGIGIFKTCIDAADEIDKEQWEQEPRGYEHDLGEPYVEIISIDDFIFDSNARNYEEAAFFGNKYRVRKDWFLKCDLYDKEIASKVASMNSLKNNSAASISTKKVDDYVEYVELVDIWIPYTNRLITIPYDSPVQAALRDEIFVGPESGPYSFIGFDYIPDNAMPISPIASWYDLSILVNRVAKKNADQIAAQKTIIVVDKTGEDKEEFAQNIVDGANNEVITGAVNSVQKISIGEISPYVVPQLDFYMSQANKISGNMETIGGLASSAQTLGQEQILQSQSSVRINDYRNQVHKAVKDIVEKMAFYLMYTSQSKMVRTIVNGVEMEVEFNPEAMENDYSNFTFEIDVASMVPDSPEQKVQKANFITTQVLLPVVQLIPVLSEIGYSFDVKSMITDISMKLNLPEYMQYLKEIPQQVITAQAPQGQSTQQQQPQRDNRTSMGQNPNGTQALNNAAQQQIQSKGE